MTNLKMKKGIFTQIYAFKGVKNQDGKVSIIPSYYRRKLKEKFYALTHLNKPRLNYAEIIWMHRKMDIIHVQHSFLFPKVLGLLEMPRANRPKIVITLRGGDTYVKPWIHDKWRVFYKDFSNKVDAFVVMSLHQKHYLQQWGIHDERIHVIPISFGQTFNIKPKFPNDKVLKIVSAFRLCWEKNIDGNLRVIKLLKEGGLPIQYDIYGDGPDLGQFYYLVDKYDLKDCVVCHGKIDNSALKLGLKNYDIYLQLSHSESFGVAVVEAQSLGIPAIVSNSGGLPEAILPDKSGFCIDPFDAERAASIIENLWTNKETYIQFSEQAITYSHKKFNIDIETERLTSLYNRLINESH
jgi:glycosyltransferase involved in cell wall biosynthesis